MAALDHLHATVHRDGPYRQHDDAGRSPERLSMVDHSDEPRHGLGTCIPNLFASKANRADGCRAVMEQVLAPVAPSSAGRIANELVDEFGSFSATLAARPAHLARILEGEQAAFGQLRSVAKAFTHCLKARVAATSVEVSETDVAEFLKFRIGFGTVEIFYVLYFNNSGHLIHDAPISHGSLTSCEAHGRSIVQAALDVGAAMVVLAHNHPSGDPTPSRADITITRRIYDACRQLDIRVFDHLVICRDRVESFRTQGLL
jgi:DNA repair protein RadC